MNYKLFFHLILIVFFVLPVKIFAADYYWVGGTGKWSDYQNHWATTSGGTSFHTIVPSAFDNVIFDFNSHSGTFHVTLDQTVIACNNLSFNLEDRVMTLSGAIGSNFNIYGSIQLHKNLSIDYLGNFVLKSVNAGNTIAQRGARFITGKSGNFILDSQTGGWQILDSLNAYSLFLENGSLNAEGKNVRLNEFISKSSNVRSINFKNTKAVIKACSIYGKNLTSDFSGSKISTLEFVNYDLPAITLDTLSPGPVSLGSYSMYIQGNLKINTVHFDRTGGIIFLNTKVTIDKLISNAESVSVRGQVLIKESEFHNLKSFEVKDAPESIELEQTNLSGKDCGNYLSIFGKGKIIKRSGVLDMSYVIASGVEFTGGAVFNATNSVDHGNTKGITITPASAATYYWIGGAGSWNDPAHWSLTSGGTPAYCVPTSMNDAVFDENSFTKDKEKVDLSNAVCKTIDFRTVKYLPVIFGQLSVYGSLYFKKGIDVAGLNPIQFLSPDMNNKIDFAKTNFKNNITLRCSGSYILEDSLQASIFTFIAGTLNTNNKKVIASSFGPSNSETQGSRKLILDSSTLRINRGLNLSQSLSNPLVIESGNSTIECHGDGYSVDLGSNHTFNVVNINKGVTVFAGGVTIESLYLGQKCTIQGDKNTFKNLRLEAGHGVSFKGSTTQYINNIFIVNPSCTYTELSGIDGKPTISKSSGAIHLDRMTLKDIAASGGATFTAINSIDQGGNNGWNISVSENINFYWIGGNGNWSDGKKWSYTSGGKPANCVPSLQDNVVFDEHSFYDFNQKLRFDVPASCKNMTWQNVKYYPATSGSIVTVNGSLTLDSAMFFNTSINFNALEDSKVKTSGNKLENITINAQKSITFVDDLFASYLLINSGTVLLSNIVVNIGSYFQLGPEKPINLDISNSKIHIFYQMHIQGDHLVLNAANSDIYCYSGDNYSNVMVTNILNDPYSGIPDKIIELNNIHFKVGSNLYGWDNGTNLHLEYCHVNRVTVDKTSEFQANLFSGLVKEFYCESENLFLSQYKSKINKSILLSYKIRLYKSVKFDYLQLAPGCNITMTAGDTLYINDDFNAYGKPDFPIYFSSETGGKQVHIVKPSGTVCLDYLHLKDIKASGGATFKAGHNSTNISNNTGWDFTTNCEYFSAYAEKPICLGGDIKLHSSVPSGQAVSWKGPENFVSSLSDPVVLNPQPSQYGFFEMTYGGKKSMVDVSAEELSAYVLIYEYGNYLYTAMPRTDLTYTWYKDNVILEENVDAVMKTGAGVYYLEITTAAGCTERSKQIKVKSYEAPPAAPVNLVATALSSSQIKLTWTDKSTDESGFIIEKQSNNSLEFEILDTVYNASEYTDKFLYSGTSYTYRVYAYNASSRSDYAGPVTAETHLVTGTESIKERRFTFFPNPTTGNVKISLKDSQTINLLRVYNDKGTMVYSIENYHSDTILDLSSMTSGVYMIQVTSEGFTSNEKLIIQ
ncbi:hypothetical protein MYP_3332 [Sporocytophaga myxococcoides]|uniref:Fibronectin type-III domain-containing protein n=1 Tax=Sporocytophaga myxococcoides TaxID=153721 RepID=A0A098LIV7_9BACT|nr:T9SS type A sorting domain-containing protein [Sporocytophaga myxococcoides]GAL86103.1 hypothetical protein MYP_3332 [Sporocytophaga myxococcoides]